MKKPMGFFTYFYHSALIGHLSDEQAGRLYKALLRYGDEGYETAFDDDQACALAFIILRGEIDLNFERYAETCENRSRAAKEREERKRRSAKEEKENEERFSPGSPKDID